MTPGIRSVADDPYRAVMQAAENDAPYLARLIERREDLVEILRQSGPDAVLESSLSALSKLPPESGIEQTGQELRRSKNAVHLACAAADLAGIWSLRQTTSVLSHFADLAINKALAAAWLKINEKGQLSMPLEQAGLFVLGMGKLGAHELNYSSDIDLIVLFDPARNASSGGSVAWMRDTSVRIVRHCLQMLHEVTEDGYVFRVDLRLRPDPGSTAIAVSTEYALGYYESIGQNWERMAFIKARVCGGDQTAANSFLKQLDPFIWRKHLDYWAIEDIGAISAQIHAGAQHHDLGDPAFDVKLGRGGIREIEFLAQTRQLILGGREARLRLRETCPTLEMLARLGIILPTDAQDLIKAYEFLRTLEHRIQMRQDEQTHFLPEDKDIRTSIVRLCGGTDVATFDTRLIRIRQCVHGAYAKLFEPEESLSGRTGNLVFTGVDDDPDTVRTLSEMGFSDPPTLIAAVRDWHRGGLAATRSARGRGLLTRLTPRLLEVVAATGSPDMAWLRLVDFLMGLKVGVQVFSLMLAEPELTEDLIATMAYAPQLGRDLVQRPDLLEAMLGTRFHKPLREDPPGSRLQALTDLTARADFEDVCDAVRLFKREEFLRIGYQLLKRSANVHEVGLAYADLAEACIHALAHRVVQELELRHGPWSARWAVCGLGRLGAAEMTATSDLDLILIHEAVSSDEDERMATRFTQRLVSALSAPTAEGSLYEVDMRLRPSGRAGPVAVKLSAFKSYYQGQAWTWEYMALTRLRPLVGDPDLCRRIKEATHMALAQARLRSKNLRADIHAMRLRLERERPPASEWDLKLMPGGLFDAEFLIQKEILETIAETPETACIGTLDALEALHKASAFSDTQAQTLREGIVLQQKLGQALSVADASAFNPKTAASGLKSWLSAINGEPNFEALHQRLTSCQSAIAELRRKKIGPLATES